MALHACCLRGAIRPKTNFISCKQKVNDYIIIHFYLFSALSRERHLATKLQDTTQREKAWVGDLQAALDLEKSKVLDLHHALERERYKLTLLNDDEKVKNAEDLDREHATCRQLKNNADALQVSQHSGSRPVADCMDVCENQGH